MSEENAEQLVEQSDQQGSCSSCHMPGHSHGYVGTKDNYLSRLRRIEGQVRGIERMVEQEKYCIDILTQVAAVNSALKSVALMLLDEHMGSCVIDAARTSDEAARDKLDEAAKAIARLVKS